MTLYRGLINALAISLFLYAWIAVWFSLTAFMVLMVASMLCLIGAERIRRVQLRRERERVCTRRDADVFTVPFWQLPEFEEQ